MNILDELAEKARERVIRSKEILSEEQLIELVKAMPAQEHAFYKVLRKPGLSFICECKQASPSRGQIAETGSYQAEMIAASYEAAGADCISVLTEPSRFLGSLEDLESVCRDVSVPVLRKDFTVDPYMIYEARLKGADAILLIASLLKEEEIRSSLRICEELGMDALCEARNEEEIESLIRAGASIIGVNNRNLADFSVDSAHAAGLRKKVPQEILFVCESGLNSRSDTEAAEAAGADAVLIGEAMMKAEDPVLKLQELRGKRKEQ